MSQRTATDSLGKTLGVGAAAGALSYVVGYLVTYLWQASSVQERLESYNAIVEFLGGDPIPAWQAVGWLFYNAHGVAFTYPALGEGQASRNLIADGSAAMLLYLVPAVVLVLAGFVLARYANADDASTGAKRGAAVAAGYVVLAVVGLFVFEYTAGGSAIHPEYVPGVLLAGVVYPAVFGAVGGVLGSVTAT